MRTDTASRLLLLMGMIGVIIFVVCEFFVQVSLAQSLPSVQGTREKIVTIYPKIFADYQQSSFQNQTTKAVGHRLWLLPNPDSSQKDFPAAIIVAESGLTVQYGDRFRQIGFDGTMKWEMPNDPGIPVFVGDTVVYFRGTNHFLQGVTFDKKTVLTDFTIPRCRDRGGVPMVQARGDNHFLIQTFNMAPEVIVDSPPEPPDYNLMLMGPEGHTDCDWMREFEGNALPALVTSDNARVVLLNAASGVMVFDIVTGKTMNSFEITKAGFQQVSLDRRDRFVVSLYDAKAQPQLACYSLSGKAIWSCPLPSAERRDFRQPPAVDSDNRIAYIWGDTLLAIAEGTVRWRHVVPTTSFVPYITVLGDNSLLLAAGNTLWHLNRDGKLLLEICLEPEEQVTTPPVIDSRGRIYVGTTAGVYCWE